MIKINADLFYELRHALIESRDANRVIAKDILYHCTLGLPGSIPCANCQQRAAAHEVCADQASNFLSRMEADRDHDNMERGGSPFSRAGVDFAGRADGIERRSAGNGTFGEEANLNEALGETAPGSDRPSPEDDFREAFGERGLYSQRRDAGNDGAKAVRQDGILVGVEIDGRQRNIAFPARTISALRAAIYRDDGK